MEDRPDTTAATSLTVASLALRGAGVGSFRVAVPVKDSETVASREPVEVGVADRVTLDVALPESVPVIVREAVAVRVAERVVLEVVVLEPVTVVAGERVPVGTAD
jgi:hypothetical protein